MDIYDIKRRAEALSAKTDLMSIIPPDVGNLINDLAIVVNDNNTNGIQLGIKQTYKSVASMNEATSPVDYEGNPLKKGNLVIINSDDGDANKVYSFNKPGWQFVTKAFDSLSNDVVEWSGIFVENANILQQSYNDNNPENIVFVNSEKRFVYKTPSGLYYDNWIGRDRYNKNNMTPRNYFISITGETFVVNSNLGLSVLPQRFFNLPGDVKSLPAGIIQNPESVFGNAADILEAVRLNKLIMSGPINLQIIKFEYDVSQMSIIEFVYIKKNVSLQNINYAIVTLMIGRGNIWSDCSITQIETGTEDILADGDIVLPDKSTMSPENYKLSGRSDAIGVVFDKNKKLFVRKNKYTGVLANGVDALGIFYAKVGCQEPYDGKITQKMNLLRSSAPSTHFPVFSYAENNDCYVASNGELELINKVKSSLTIIGSDLFTASIASCTQNPLSTAAASVFYGGNWRSNDVSNPSSSLNYALIDIL